MAVRWQTVTSLRNGWGKQPLQTAIVKPDQKLILHK